MTYKIILKEQRAQVVVKERNNGTRITSEPDNEGSLSLEVEIDHASDVLALYHSGMEACRQQQGEWEKARKVA
jgi:hypothetical protein